MAREEAGVVIPVEAKNKSSKDIAAAISSDEDDYNDDKFEGNDTGGAKPSKPSRPVGQHLDLWAVHDLRQKAQHRLAPSR